MDALHDDVPIVVVDVKIPMTPITPEISASVVYMDWMILILDETPSFDNQLQTANHSFTLYTGYIATRK